jgi:hypothetical protein
MDESSGDRPTGPRTLEGRQTVVTGAASPAGRAIVAALAREGAMVIATDVTDGRVEQAMAAIGLAEADEVITRRLEETRLGSWWDLANLVDAYYHALDLLVHVPAGDVSASLPHAVARLEHALANAEVEGRGRASVLVVSDAAGAGTAEAARALAAPGHGVALRVLPADPIAASVAAALEGARAHADSSSPSHSLPTRTREEVRHA